MNQRHENPTGIFHARVVAVSSKKEIYLSRTRFWSTPGKVASDSFLRTEEELQSAFPGLRVVEFCVFDLKIKRMDPKARALQTRGSAENAREHGRS